MTWLVRTVIAVLLAVIAIAVTQPVVVKAAFDRYAVSSAAKRQAWYVCDSLEKGRATREELCTMPLPEIPSLQNHYRFVAEQDADWYRRRGAKYYPAVECGAELRVHFMGGVFRCEGDTPIVEKPVEVSVGEAAAEEPVGDQVRFSHSITIHPVPGLPSLVSVSEQDGSEITNVRVHLLLDGELLIVPLQFFSVAFRGSFPTPVKSLSYRFQVIQRNGKSSLSEWFTASLQCDEDLPSRSPVSAELVKRASDAQALDQRIRTALRLLKKYEEER